MIPVQVECIHKRNSHHSAAVMYLVLFAVAVGGFVGYDFDLETHDERELVEPLCHCLPPGTHPGGVPLILSSHNKIHDTDAVCVTKFYLDLVE